MHSGCHFRQAWMSPIYYPTSRSGYLSCATHPALLLVREGYPGTAHQCLRQNNQKPGAASRGIPSTALFFFPSPPRPLQLAKQAKKILLKSKSISYLTFFPQRAMYPEVCLRFRGAKETYLRAWQYWKHWWQLHEEEQYIHMTYLLFLISGEIQDEAWEASDVEGKKYHHWETDKTNQGLGTKSSPSNSFTARSAEGTQRWPHKAASRHTVKSAQLHCVRTLWPSFLQHPAQSYLTATNKVQDQESWIKSHQKKIGKSRAHFFWLPNTVTIAFYPSHRSSFPPFSHCLQQKKLYDKAIFAFMTSKANPNKSFLMGTTKLLPNLYT